MKNFPGYGPDGLSLTATSSSGATPVAFVDSNTKSAASDVMLYNPGTVECTFKLGGPDVVATADSMVLPPGSLQPFSKGRTTHVAVFCATGTQAVRLWVGEGA